MVSFLFVWFVRCRPFEERTAMIGIDPTSSNMAHHPVESSNTGSSPKSTKDATGKKREESKSAKKPKEKPDALSQFDLNNYASEYYLIANVILTILSLRFVMLNLSLPSS